MLLLAIAAALPGCGASSDGAHIKGKVTVNGQPLPADAIGTVTFQTTTPGKGRMVSGPIENSAFDIPSAPVGALKAYFTVQQPTGRTIDNGRGTPAQEFKTMISDKYSAGIDVQVDGSNDALDFALDGA